MHTTTVASNSVASVLSVTRAATAATMTQVGIIEAWLSVFTHV